MRLHNRWVGGSIGVLLAADVTLLALGVGPGVAAANPATPGAVVSTVDGQVVPAAEIAGTVGSPTNAAGKVDEVLGSVDNTVTNATTTVTNVVTDPTTVTTIAATAGTTVTTVVRTVTSLATPLPRPPPATPTTRCVPSSRNRCAKPKPSDVPPAARPSAPSAFLAAVSRPRLGDGNPFTFMALDDGVPVRWDPCQPVHYVVNPTFAPAGGTADLERALQILGDATGIRFQSDGLTTDFPTRANLASRPNPPDRWPPVMIAWVTPDVSDLIEPGTAGVGGAAWMGFPGQMTFITGQVAIDAAAARRLPPGFGPSASHGALVLHELGHMIGLGHAGDPSQLMYPTIGGEVGDLAAGDRAGLELLGAKQGCKPASSPF